MYIFASSSGTNLHARHLAYMMQTYMHIRIAQFHQKLIHQMEKDIILNENIFTYKDIYNIL